LAADKFHRTTNRRMNELFEDFSLKADKLRKELFNQNAETITTMELIKQEHDSVIAHIK